MEEHTPAENEFENIIAAPTHDRLPGQPPPRARATYQFTREVRDALEIPEDHATEAADWVIDKMVRYAAAHAEPMLTLNGAGPVCSLCRQRWGTCGHDYLSQVPVWDTQPPSQSESPPAIYPYEQE